MKQESSESIVSKGLEVHNDVLDDSISHRQPAITVALKSLKARSLIHTVVCGFCAVFRHTTIMATLIAVSLHWYVSLLFYVRSRIKTRMLCVCQLGICRNRLS